MMNFSNLALSGAIGILSVFSTQAAFSANPSQRADDKARSACDCTAGEEFSDGYVFMEPTEMALFNARPLDLLADARKEFRDRKNLQAAADIHIASELIKIQAAGNLRGSHLNETAKNLENLSRRVTNNEIKSVSSLDFELTQAARDEAEHHNLHAAEAWTHHMAKNVGADLTAAVSATEKSVEWSGQKLSAGGEKTMEATKSLSQKILSGGKWTADEVGKGIASLGSEINRLGRKIEPTEKSVK